MPASFSFIKLYIHVSYTYSAVLNTLGFHYRVLCGNTDSLVFFCLHYLFVDGSKYTVSSHAIAQSRQVSCQ